MQHCMNSGLYHRRCSEGSAAQTQGSINANLEVVYATLINSHTMGLNLTDRREGFRCEPAAPDSVAAIGMPALVGMNGEEALG